MTSSVHRSLPRLGVFVAISTLALVASAHLASIGDSSVKFQATGPAGMKIDGDSSQLSATEADGRLTVTAPLGHLHTGIALRDKHLRRYLATDKYPDATLSIERAKLKLPDDNQSVTSSATGNFTLHGVTKPLTFNYKAARTGSDYHVQALATVDIRDFGIEVPCYLGVCVEPQVKLKVAFKLRETQ